MLKLNAIDYIAHILVVVGAVNWGLVGFFNYDLVGALFGGAASVISRCIFALVGLAGLYVISFFFRRDRLTA
ncbi:MAG TPA: DUF378 domain-containing protein [Candidatus Avidehalobacter gallistercoris]|uniref:DUF378 domain-containing protein n=1 Tax=Candidatus Avidehalobacter gallistercoris TaxID=2840694 RepID=A0A9D1HKK9_9FIRM|nr:DUF378 domain-containing protein [Candidatus Avidehalobacter gallistercoris]